MATRFGHDNRVAALIYRSWALWMLGYPEAALADAERALKYARELGQAATLMLALCFTSLTYSFCGSYSVANARLDEDRALANEKGAALWKAFGMLSQGCVLALTGKNSDAAQTITAGLAEFRATGSTFWTPLFLSYLAKAHAELRQLDDAWRSIDEVITAVQATKETLCEAEIQRVAGEIALLSPERDVAKAEAYFERALVVARQQQAKSWELRAATSLARLWRDQGKVQQAPELLAPIYGWFTEGFDTRDLKEAKALLDELAA
jgi:predicted ATPase